MEKGIIPSISEKKIAVIFKRNVMGLHQFSCCTLQHIAGAAETDDVQISWREKDRECQAEASAGFRPGENGTPSSPAPVSSETV
jgi:hypothetical protein